MCSILRITEYTLYRVPGFLVSRQIGAPPPQASVSVGSWGETHSLAGEGAGEPIPMKGQELLYSMYTIIPLRRELKYTDKKENKILLIYKEIQMGAVAKSYMRKGFLIYEEMRKYLVIYEEAVSHI